MEPRSQSESLESFVRWTAAQLSWPLRESQGELRIAVPAEHREALGGENELRWVLNGAADGAPGEHCQDADGPALRYLLRTVCQGGGYVHAEPKSQPHGVAEITSGLFSAYQVDGGSMHLGGCSLDDRLFVRLTYRVQARRAGDALDEPYRHYYFHADGMAVDDETAVSLGLHEVASTRDQRPHHPPSTEPGTIETAIARAKQALEGEEGGITPQEPLLVALVWCKFASGVLVITIGEAELQNRFEGWARTLAAPPIICPHSGMETFHLAATDDGRIAAAEALATCGLSGRRTLKRELVQCSATGKWVLPEHAVVCPVTGESVIEAELFECPATGLRVSPAAVKDGVCQLVQDAPAVTKDDPRMAYLLGEYPGLDAWRNWRLAETADHYLAIAAGVLRRLLVVAEKEPLQVCRLATRMRLSKQWQAVPPEQFDEVLRRRE